MCRPDERTASAAIIHVVVPDYWPYGDSERLPMTAIFSSPFQLASLPVVRSWEENVDMNKVSALVGDKAIRLLARRRDFAVCRPMHASARLVESLLTEYFFVRPRSTPTSCA